MTTTKPIRVLCVDDHDFLAEGLQARLSLEEDLECVGRATRADDLAEEVRRTSADIILLDIDMPGRDPFEAMTDLRRLYPDTRTIMLSAYILDHYIDAAFDAGAWGYFSKTDAPEAVVSGIRRVARGEYAIGDTVQQRVASTEHPATRPSKLNSLTPREREILRMIGKGMSRADIARSLHRSVKTVDAHHTSIMKKLDIHDRAELALYAVREGLTESGAPSQ